MPPQMNPAAARVIDPILTNHARVYKNEEFVLEQLFPEVISPTRGGRVIKFNKESFRRHSARRAPGAKTKRVQFGYASDPIALHQERLEAVTPHELQDESGATTQINLQAASVSALLDSMLLNSEYERGQIATDAARYAAINKAALSGTDQWSDPTANVKQLINDGKETVRKKTGHKPNILVVSSAQLDALESNEGILERVKYTSSESITAALLARYFQVDKVIVPLAVSIPEDAPEDADFEDVWSNFALLAYVPKSVSGMHQPSYGYTYRKAGYPLVEAGYDDRNTNSMINPVTVEEAPYLTSPDAGFLISNVIG